MATVSRFSAVAKVGKLEFGGFIAWVGWLGLHLFYQVGYRNRLTTIISWFVTFLGRGRAQMASTEQQVFARLAIEQLHSLEKSNADLETSLPTRTVDAITKEKASAAKARPEKPAEGVVESTTEVDAAASKQHTA